METHKFTITISGTQKEATDKANGLAILGTHLSADTIVALAKVVQTDPNKVALAKRFLGVV